jgi:hypothetical protein
VVEGAANETADGQDSMQGLSGGLILGRLSVVSGLLFACLPARLVTPLPPLPSDDTVKVAYSSESLLRG